MDARARRERLDGLAGEPDRQRRRLVALGLLTDRLAPSGIVPILVGGGALEFYTDGGYATKDMDPALPVSPEVDPALPVSPEVDTAFSVSPEVDTAFSELGFEKEGRYWFREDLDLLFEAPAPAGLPGENAPRTEVEIEGLRVVVLGIEDLLMDRLRGWVHRKSEEDGRWARRLALLYSDRLDWRYLRERAGALPEEPRALEEIARGAEAP